MMSIEDKIRQIYREAAKPSREELAKSIDAVADAIGFTDILRIYLDKQHGVLETRALGYESLRETWAVVQSWNHLVDQPAGERSNVIQFRGRKP